MKKLRLLFNVFTILTIICFTGCTDKKSFEETVFTQEINGGEDEYLSQMFLDSEGNPSYYYRDYSHVYNEEYVYDIINDEKWNPVLPEKVQAYLDESNTFILWEDTIRNSHDGKYDYIIHLLHERNYKNKSIIYLDEDDNIVYDLILDDFLVLGEYNAYRFFVMDDGNICIAETGMGTKKVTVINPYTESVVLEVEYDFIPRMLVGDRLIGINGKGDEVVVLDLLSGEETNRIPTGINSDSNYEPNTYDPWDLYLDIYGYGEYIYMVNVNGIYRTTLDGGKFEVLVKAEDTKYIGGIGKYEELLREVDLEEYFIKLYTEPTNKISYEILIKNDEEVYVKVGLLESGGVGSYDYFIKYELY